MRYCWLCTLKFIQYCVRGHLLLGGEKDKLRKQVLMCVRGGELDVVWVSD